MREVMVYILLPAYNEEKSFELLIPELVKHISEEGFGFKIIICNDGSDDNTSEVLDKLGTSYPFEILTHKINRGLGETSRDLFERAAELAKPDDVIVRLDCDNTHEPQYIARMIKELDEGYDIVTASRFQAGGGQSGVSLYRGIISYCAQIFIKVVFGLWSQKEFSCGFRAYRASIIQKAIEIYGNQFIQLKGLGFTCTLEKMIKLKMLGARFSEIGFQLRYDKKSSYSKMVTSITTLGYFIMAVLYHWPFGGWRRSWPKRIRQYESSQKSH
jgi:dolichol-phosphate mannosyltransferase